jgi:ArsR family metal-binding transcriptional regulator
MHLASIAPIRTLPCLAEPGKLIVVVKPGWSLEEVIPYLATLLEVIAYNPEVCTLTFPRRPGFLTLYAEKISSPR